MSDGMDKVIQNIEDMTNFFNRLNELLVEYGFKSSKEAISAIRTYELDLTFNLYKMNGKTYDEIKEAEIENLLSRLEFLKKYLNED